MSSKTRELFEVTFWAKKRVKAFTHEEAQGIVENMKDIKLIDGIDSKVTTKTKFEVFTESLTMNISTVVTCLVGIFYIWTLVLSLKAVQNLEPNFQLIGTFSLVTLIIVTIRFPNTVGRWFDFKRY